MKSMTWLVGALMLALVGCASVQTSHDFRGIKVDGNAKPVAVVAIDNSGWYLFGCLPIVTGDPENPGGVRFFHDTVTLEGNLAMLDDKVRAEHGANVVNLNSRVCNDLAIGLFIFGRKQVFTSAVITQ